METQEQFELNAPTKIVQTSSGTKNEIKTTRHVWNMINNSELRRTQN